MTKKKLLFLTAKEVRKALPMAEAVEVMKKTFIRLSSGQARVPLRTHIEAPSAKGNALFMPSYLPDEGRMGVKIVTLFDENQEQGLPRIQALMIVVDGTTGSPLAVMDGSMLTALRTGAASGAATDLLARKDVERAAIFGAGVQGRTQLEAMCAVRPIKKAYVFDADRARAETFAQEMTGCLNIPVKAAVSSSEAAGEGEVICTATTSSTPVFEDGLLKEGAHINAVGSYQPHVQEIPAETVKRALVFVDQREAALSETGDLIIPLSQGIITEEHIHGELGEIAAGTKEGRTSDRIVTLFKSVGIAVQDLAASIRVLANAEKLGLGTSLPLL